MNKVPLLALLIVLAGCDPTDPYPDHPGKDSSFSTKHMRSEDSDAYPVGIVVHYDCKAPNMVPAVSFPHGIPGSQFVPKFESSRATCTPANGITSGETCTQQIWKVGASYNCPHCGNRIDWWGIVPIPKIGTSRSMNDVPFGEIDCDCECVKASGGCDGSGRHTAGHCVDPSSLR